MTYELPTGRPLGGRRAGKSEALRVDYADVLAQAVANERNRILFELRRTVSNIPVRENKRGSTWDMQDRGAAAVREEAVRAIEAMQS